MEIRETSAPLNQASWDRPHPNPLPQERKQRRRVATLSQTAFPVVRRGRFGDQTLTSCPTELRFRGSLHAHRWSDRAFTLLEIMVVVIILGVLAATILPQFIGTTYDAKVSATKAHIAELEAAVERFNLNMDRYPTMEEGLKVLVEAPTGSEGKWRGPYISQLRQDPWDHPYQYRVPGTHHQSRFDIWSRGADRGEGQGTDIGNW